VHIKFTKWFFTGNLSVGWKTSNSYWRD